MILTMNGSWQNAINKKDQIEVPVPEIRTIQGSPENHSEPQLV